MIKVLITSCGYPGIPTLIRWLRRGAADEGRELEIVGVDCDAEAAGRFFADAFYRVPPHAQEAEYLEAMRAVVEQESPDAILPGSIPEACLLAANAIDVPVMASQPEATRLAMDRYQTYETLRGVVPLPRYYSPKTLRGFEARAHELGWPERPVCFKPHRSAGNRGFRIIDECIDRRALLLEQKPGSRYISMQEFAEIFSTGNFPDLVLMEYLDGEEVTADVLCLDGEMLLTTVRTTERDGERGELVDRPGIVEQARAILQAIPLSYCVSLRFVGDRLVEINPRVSTFIYQDDLIAPYLALKLAVGEIEPDEIRAYNDRIAYGRRMVRYVDRQFIPSATIQDQGGPFLSLVTRCCWRPEGLRRNIESVLAQTCHDVEQIFLVDRVRRGLTWANQQFERHRQEPCGRYVYHLDDDDYLEDAQFIEALRARAFEADHPDVILVQVDGSPQYDRSRKRSPRWPVLPPPSVWDLDWEHGERPERWIGCGYCFATRVDTWRAHAWRYYCGQGTHWTTGGDWKFATGFINSDVRIVRLDDERRGATGHRSRCKVEDGCSLDWFEQVARHYDLERIVPGVWRRYYG